ncbi:uncharacterized protein K452DRAFT_230487 [Aplosporella prunicola CBS 121167]|uniref:Peptidase A1 domain-containing protein n=1 Tax=Aplosporella prunicola CBS 121167 TaxID=1176127 RepID=A0A6A6B820_9PEZI|nr:uncharacterized protein K452DRAFT_230487 [Aplosporella prunicola CBS 121167]KAF2140240.1 hypothetical protein K452DRAFT_230487 [Aplosporella prunicola CBS 121167]
MARLLVCGYLLFWLTRASLTFNCSLGPIYVDMHKRAVHGTPVYQYGTFLGVGSPSQNQSLVPSLSHNEISVASIDYCKHSRLPHCVNETHGNFNFSESGTWLGIDDYSAIDDTGDFFNESFAGQDELHIFTHFLETNPPSEEILHNFTFEVATKGEPNPGIVGLGPKSTLLQQLYDNNRIAGRTYSIYTASGSERAGGVVNGSLTLGGYDSNRFTGIPYSYRMDTFNASPLSVKVSDIVLEDPSNSHRNISLFSASEFPELKDDFQGFEAEITTDQYPLSLPYEITQNYISALSAVPSDNPDGSLSLSKPYNGSMTIVLSNGFRATLPREVMYNVSGLSPVADRNESSTTPNYLSLAWLSQVYLMLDYDSSVFYLAQVVPLVKYAVPKTFCPGTVPQHYIPPRKGFAARGLIGAVLGGFIGGIALLCLVWVLFTNWRKGRVGAMSERQRLMGLGCRGEWIEIPETNSNSPQSRKGKARSLDWPE